MAKDLTVAGALRRLLENKYTDPESHRADVVTMRNALRDQPAAARRWKWLRERLSLPMINTINKSEFYAPTRSYVSDVEDTIDRLRTRDHDVVLRRKKNDLAAARERNRQARAQRDDAKS